MYSKIKVTIEGLAPLVMHNGQLADPLNPFVLAIADITSKGKKQTTEDRKEVARLEWRGGLYVDEQERPCVTGEMLEAMIRAGATANKRGKDVAAGVICDGNYPLTYDGPSKPDQLVEDMRYRLTRGVKIGKSRIMRTRPMFKVWSLKFVISYLPGVIDKSAICKALEVAGQVKGIGDYRPRYGRFVVLEFA